MKEQISIYPKSRDGKAEPVIVGAVGLVAAVFLGTIGHEYASQQVTRGKFFKIGMTVTGAALGGGLGATATAFLEITSEHQEENSFLKGNGKNK